MERAIIWRGLLAGALAGVLAFVFATLFFEPIIGRSVDFEDRSSQAHEAMGHGGHATSTAWSCSPAGCSPTSAWDSASLAFGVAMGALFAVLFCACYGRFANLSARALSALVAGALLVACGSCPR